MQEKYKNFLNLGTIVGILAFFSGLYLLFSGENIFIGISGSITGLFVAYISSFGAEKKNQE